MLSENAESNRYYEEQAEPFPVLQETMVVETLDGSDLIIIQHSDFQQCFDQHGTVKIWRGSSLGGSHIPQ